MAIEKVLSIINEFSYILFHTELNGIFCAVAINTKFVKLQG